MSATSAETSMQDIAIQLRKILLEAANVLSECDASNSKTTNHPKEQDLTKWTYAELRSVINSKEVDAALLESCRKEFHRRLKVYHNWKIENDETKTVEKPSANDASPFPCRTASLAANKDRYFRIPFIKTGKNVMAEIPDDVRGWWYAHFEGQFVARQMEVFQSQTPLLLVVGKDDLQMCDLTLEETGLVKKKGAEILAEDFENTWQKHGGKPYKSKR